MSRALAFLGAGEFEPWSEPVDRWVLERADGVLFAPHWDTVERWYPGAQACITASLRPGETLVAIDEETAMAGDGSAWSVLGRSAVHVYRDGRFRTVPAGEGFELALELGPSTA